MSRYTTKESNNIVNGNTVSITIRIANSDNKPISFTNGKISIINVDKLLIANKNSAVQYRDNLNNKNSLNYNNNKYNFTKISKNIPFFDIEIYGELNVDFNFQTPIIVEIKEDENYTEKINFSLYKAKENLIKSFIPNATIIQKSSSMLSFDFSLNGEPEKVVLFENGIEIRNDLVTTTKVTNLLKDKQPGIYEYTLKATKGELTASKSHTVLYVDESKISTRTSIANRTIINFCVAQEEDFLFALTTDSNNNFKIYYTHQIDGDDWQEIKDGGLDEIMPFINSPMLHLQSDDEKDKGKLGRIFFIGGSRLEKSIAINKTANKVLIIDLGKEESGIIVHDKVFDARWGHTCVLFPKGENQNTIWMFGGVDRNGKSLNEIWTSTDGVNWSKTDNPEWESRVMHSACVSYNKENRTNEALYLGGGFDNLGGNFISQIFKYQNKEWIKIIEYVNKEKIKVFGLGYGGIENEGDTGIYTIAIDEVSIKIKMLSKDNNNVFRLVDKDKNNLDINSYNQGIFITAFFKECLWFMKVNSLGDEGYSYSNLFYRIPTIHQTTINFYNDKK